MFEKRACALSSTGWTPSTFAAACAGVKLASRSRNFISTVLKTVIATVPAAPANNPLPTAAATSPSFVLTSPPAYSGAPGLLGVLALGELLDDLRAKGRQVVGGTARDQALVGDNLLVHPGAPGVADVCLEGRVGGQRAAPHHVRFDKGPRAVADHADRLGSFEDGAPSNPQPALGCPC